ncbi:MAG: NAD-dependent epimerase/dehydratase family protein [Actinomycetota bacterium]
MTQVGYGNTIAVTGATGFVGQALVENLSAAGYGVIGISERPEPPSRISGLLKEYVRADLTRGWPTTGPFNGVVHLAGLAAVQPSFDHPQDYLNTNSSMVTHFFEHALRHAWNGRTLIVSSGAVYGTACSDSGFTEESPVVATSPYVVSKLLVETQVEYYRRRGVEALVVRPFNHIGPGQGPGFVVPDLAHQVASAQRGGDLAVGNLHSARDYTDVRDIARAYRLLLELPNPRESTYNVCSGHAHTGWQVLDAVCEALGREVPPTRVTDSRAIDPEVITGSAARLRLETGWVPTYMFAESISDFVSSS